MNDLRVGYFTTAMRSHTVSSPNSCWSTSPKKTGLAPTAVSESSGEYRSSASLPLIEDSRPSAYSATSRYFIRLTIHTGPSWSGGSGGQLHAVVGVDGAIPGDSVLLMGCSLSGVDPGRPGSASFPGPPLVRRFGSVRSPGSHRPPNGWRAGHGTGFTLKQRLRRHEAPVQGGGVSLRCRVPGPACR